MPPPPNNFVPPPQPPPQQPAPPAPPSEISVKPHVPGTDPRTGLTLQQKKDWLNQPIYGKPTAENPGPAHDPGSNAWGQVKDAIGSVGGLKGQAINDTVSAAIRSGDAGRVGQALNALGIDGVDPNDIIGHYNNRTAAWSASGQGQEASQNWQNQQLTNMSRHDFKENVVHPQLREKYRKMRAMGYATPHVASRGTTHHVNKHRPAFVPHGQPDSEGNQRFRENKRLRGGHRGLMGNWIWNS